MRNFPMNALLRADADVNAENHSGERPIMLAAAEGHAEIVDRLLRNGAYLAGATRSGDTALTLATRADVIDRL
jgi:ankyrin repeat protein